MTDRCPACRDLTAPCSACFAASYAARLEEFRPMFDACCEMAALVAPKPAPVASVRVVYVGHLDVPVPFTPEPRR